jgi:hypothetical protein
VQLLLLLMLIVPLYFIAVFAVREKKRRKQDQHLREMVVPPNQVKMSNADIDSKILVVDGGGGVCHLQYAHHMEFGGVPSLFKTFTLKTSCVVT